MKTRLAILCMALVLAGCAPEVPNEGRADAEIADTVEVGEITLRTVTIKGAAGMRYLCIVATRGGSNTPPAIDCSW